MAAKVAGGGAYYFQEANRQALGIVADTLQGLALCALTYQYAAPKEFRKETSDSNADYRDLNDAEIAQSNRHDSSDSLYRKVKDPNRIEPMPRKQFRKIKRAFQRNGGVISQGEDVTAHLIKNSAEGVTWGSDHILLVENPSRAAVYEELIHATQYRNGWEIGSNATLRLQAEIAAQEKLLRYQRAYQLTPAEVRQTQKALDSYLKQLAEAMSKG